LTPEAEEFIERVVDTIHQLEVLMLLHRSPHRFWRIDEIAGALEITSRTVTSSVVGLHKNGVLVAEGTDPVGYRYEPRSVALHAGAESLVAAYAVDALLVVKSVLEKPPRALRTFSDAFLFRRRD
jgi:hypothetical protein